MVATAARAGLWSTPRPSRLFLAIGAAILIAVVPLPVQAAPPSVQMPFPCGETWHAWSYTGHSPSAYAVDWNLLGEDSGRSVLAGVAGTASVIPNNGGYGNMVEINAGGGWTFRYAHLSSFSIVNGATVTAQTEIGKVGNTGASSGAHLHYEQRYQNVVQPATFDGIAISYSSTYPGHAYTSANCGVGDWHWHLRDGTGAGPATYVFGYAPATDRPITGDWNGDGTMTPGIVRNVNGEWQWHLRNANSAGNTDVVFGYGNAVTDRPITGDWDGNGNMTPGIV
ncbi:M23 family metallopeptidase, partial [Allorhizocola rhizosphaerae]|uniref:M23 family metallopeptidase n=1 Tax=Allorhizocola rhizosphaerae TaxID=1872709 RepID=UPI0013C2CEAB